MQTNLEKIRKMCSYLGISHGRLSDEFLFTIDCIDYFYFEKNIGHNDISDGFTDGANDGGIDFIFNKDDIMYLVQGKSGEFLSKDDVKNALRKIDDTVEHFEQNDFSTYNKSLSSIYINKYDSLGDDKNLAIVLFTNTTFTKEVKAELDEYAKEKLANYRVYLYDKLDICNKITFNPQEDGLINEARIDLFETGNKLVYENEIGIIINIRASSLKRLYEKYKDSGLFNLNLRNQIAQKNVDDGMDTTIENEPKNFWFYNNGINIGCKEFRIDGNQIVLYGFSIINGAQTTTKIGKSPLVSTQKDFAVICKVVQSVDELDTTNKFINKISEASNSQKPIRPKDLVANSPEQKTLQRNSANNKHPLSISIKRGVKPNNFSKVYNWQRVDNEYIGQLILACSLQRPGTARSEKSQIFSSTKTYNQVFLRRFDYDTLYDFVRIAYYFNEFRTKYYKRERDPKLAGVSQNGKFTILALIFYFYKRILFNLDYYPNEKIFADNVIGKLTINYKNDDYENKLENLFKLFTQDLSGLYDLKMSELKLTSYSNFFKSDNIYREIILPYFEMLFDREMWKKELLSSMVIFSDLELNIAK